MKIISLNTWGGRAEREGLLNFFKVHADSTDVFCLQEVWSAPYDWVEGMSAGGVEIKNDEIMIYGLQEISDALHGFEALFHPHFGDNYGLAMFVNKKWNIDTSGELYVYKEKGYYNREGDIGDHGRNIQFATLNTGDGFLTVINFHGLWNGKGKTDTPQRLEQSERILQFTQTLTDPFVFCGDFNLKPDIESLKKFEDAGLRNLIKEYGVTSTRTSHYTKSEKFADYAFTSPATEVVHFEVLPDEVSDHSPLLIEIV